MDPEVFKCKVCCSAFFQKRYLTKHVMRMHPNNDGKDRNEISVQKNMSNVECKEDCCNKKFRTLPELRKHLECAHNLKDINTCRKITFPCKSEFLNWFADEEKKTNSKYVIACSEKKYVDYTYTVFNCNRSGVFKSQAKLQRKQLKAQGSIRIGHYCTSSIIMKEFESGIEVSYYAQHYKHEKELQHIPIPKEDKQAIAGKLFEGVNERRIIQDFRNIDPDQQILRRNLLTNKDLYNIKKKFGISVKSHGSVLNNDEESVHGWVMDMAKSTFNPVLLYKRQDVEHPVINQKEFMLAIMNNFQQKMFKEFGGDRVCLDSTHGISNYGFELVTLLVIDKFNEGVPVSFCITSTVNKKHLIEFFKCIRTVHFATPNVFMSDDAPMFYSAWRDVFGDCPNPLLCAWHVDRAWQGHINAIKENKRTGVYHTLKSLMYELNENIFKDLLESFITELQDDDDTKAFAKYFIDNYYNRTKMWAYCYRINAKINTNMHIENFHRSLKHIYLEGKKTKRLDKTIAELNNSVHDKKYDDIIKQYKGKITKKCTLNFKRHKEAEILNLTFKSINESEWEILSSDNVKKYTVLKIHSCSDSCVISCRSCAICPLAYQCNCYDYSIGNNICKHIHYILLSLNGKQNFIGPLNKCSVDNITDIETNEVSSLNLHEKNKEKFLSLSSQIMLVPNMDDDRAKQIRAHLNAIDNLLHSSIAQEQKLTLNEKTCEPGNKKIEKQKRFHSNKKQKTTKKPRLSKPSVAERDAKKSILLHPEFVSSDVNNDHSYC